MPFRHLICVLKSVSIPGARRWTSIARKTSPARAEAVRRGSWRGKMWVIAVVLSAGLPGLIGTQARAQTTVSTGQNPVAIAINPVTDRIYVANLGQAKFCEQSSFVTIIDGPTNNTWSAPAGLCPGAVAVNPATNLIYAVNTANFDVCCANVTVIDGVFQGSVTNITVGGDPQAAAVNPITNKIYVTNNADDTVTVIDGATNATTTVPVVWGR